MDKQRSFGQLLIAMLVLACAGNAWAEKVCTTPKDFDDYGHVANTGLPVSPGGVCASAATINSFVYLQNKYPDIYDHKLVKDYDNDNDVDNDDWVKARDLLAGGWPNSDADNGIYDGDDGGSSKGWWESKVAWIDEFAPGTTVVSGQVGGATRAELDTWEKGSALQPVYPTWDYLWSELDKCEDVEIGFFNLTEIKDVEGVEGWKIEWGHAVTVWGLCFEDAQDDGDKDNETWDEGETREIKLLDNNYPTDENISPTLTQEERAIWTYDAADEKWYSLGNISGLYFEGYRDVTSGLIATAFAESPVPEPSAVVGLLSMGWLGGIALSARRRRRAPAA